MSDSYLVICEIRVFSTDMINLVWVCFQFKIKEVVSKLPLIQTFSFFKAKFKKQLRQAFHNELDVVDI